MKLKAQSGKELEAAKSQLQKELAAAQSALEEAKEDLEMSNLDKEIAEERVRELEGELAQAHGQIEILESSQRQLSLDEEASADVKGTRARGPGSHKCREAERAAKWNRPELTRS